MNYFVNKGQARDRLDPYRDKQTLLLAASALFIFGSFIGCAIYRFLGIGESELYDNLIERYFLALFYKCDSSLDIAGVVLDCVFNELWMFVAVFLAGFTLFAPIVSGVLLLYRGILFGFSLTMLQFSSRTGLLLDSMVYICASFALSMLLSILSTRAFCFYYPHRTVRLRSIMTKEYILTFLRIASLVFINVALMLFLIYIYI